MDNGHDSKKIHSLIREEIGANLIIPVIERKIKFGENVEDRCT
jgi:hypothetical protein